ncbi:MAG: DUF2061 domain-containing protein [Draconibacterium sp.]|nr:DUF2061 domain-containing protein [Draconibacterium sp.]
MNHKYQMNSESKRRTIVKSLLWRFIGIVWTWLGAYAILLLIPPSYKTAAIIATLIVIYHHSTRLIMYYFYERIWASLSWGRTGTLKSMSKVEKILWIIGVIVSFSIIIFLIIYITPLIKGM